MSKLEQVQKILEIENENDRLAAARHFLDSLSPEERKKLLGDIDKIFQRAGKVMIPLMEQFGVIGRQIAETIENNLEVQEYLTQLMR